MLARLTAQSRVALEAGALAPLETEAVTIEDGSIKFIVRLTRSLANKPVQLDPASTGTKQQDPFAPPYNAAMHVGDVTPTHTAILNKYYVQPNHFILATKAFVHQTQPLDRADFAAIWTVLRELPFLAFFNCGDQSGASQPHKHIQLVPESMGPESAQLPVEHLFIQHQHQPGQLFTIPSFPFAHGCVGFPLASVADETTMLAGYSLLMNSLGLFPQPTEQPVDLQQPVPNHKSYNVLLTRRWIMVVPRSK